MFKLSPLCLAALIALQLPVAAAQAAPVAAATQTAMAAQIDAAIAPLYKANEPGATVIVVKDGKTVLRKAYGLADLAASKPMQPDMVLRLGSITKQFTAVAIVLLADEGKLALSDPITKYLPDYPTQGKTITIEHLLTHTSGIVSYTGKPNYETDMTQDRTVAGMIDTFKNDPLEFEPGSRMAYNNSGYFLLGAIIEKISGQRYADFLAARIFTPLGMKHTAYEGVERTAHPRAVGHSKRSTTFEPAAPLSMSQPYAAGSLVSTVDDLARWDAAISAGKLLQPASWKRAFTSYTTTDGKPTGYGYGWELGKLRGAARIAHGGGINGFSTYALRLPEQKVFVAVLSNADDGVADPALIASKAAAVAIGKPYPEYKAITLDQATLDSYTGVYQVDDKVTRTVRTSGGQVTMQRSGRPPMLLQAFAKDQFYLPNSTATFLFERDEKGAVKQVTLLNDEVRQVSMKTASTVVERAQLTLPPEKLDAMVGRYELKPGFVIELSRVGSAFFGQATGQPKFQLHAESDTMFYVKEVDAQLRIDSAEQITLLQGGQAIPGKRLK